MSRQLDSKAQALDFSYDRLGRITNRRERKNVSSLTDSAVTTVNRESTTYITSGTGKGQVNTVIYRSGESGAVLHKKVISYDGYGRVDISSTTINGNVYAEQTTYDQYSRVFQQFDASGDDRGLRYSYSNGYVSKLKEAREGASGTVYQDIQAMDARGNVTVMQLGNGVDVTASYELNSGRLLKLSAFDAMGVELQDVDYLFDVLGNLKQRHDKSGGSNLRETFSYDALSRLKSVGLSVSGAASTQTLSLNYDSSGNITYKSDVGTYLYNGSQPHAVARAGNTTYGYDANGNQTTGDGRTITYTVFDKPNVITKGTNRAEFAYGIGNSRYQRKDYEGGVLQKSTLYLGSTERITENGSTFYKRYLGGVAIATYYPSTNVQQLSYLLKDHIGSIHSVLSDAGLITATMHFSAFGQRQASNWKTPLTSFLYEPLNDITTRGFTGHEQVDSVGIVHMNGRIYDPRLGRFLQADPVVQAPKNSQSLNRYSYVLNNPLSYTDPSGYFSFSRFIKRWGRLIAAVAVSYVTYGAASAWAFGMMPSVAAGVATSAAYTASTVVGGAVAGLVGGAISSGSVKGAVKGAFFGAGLAYIGAQVRIGVENWRNGRGELWHAKYDEALKKFVPAHISDSSTVQIEQQFVNGQSNNLDEAIAHGYEQLGSSKDFYVFHNPTHGFIADTVESALGKLKNTSSISRQLAGILKGQTGSLTNLTAHSQGGIIVSNALRYIPNNALTTNTVINFNGAAVGPNIFSKTILQSGATPGIYAARTFDAVPNILGLATYNPFKIIGSALMSPLLFTPLSQHTVYIP